MKNRFGDEEQTMQLATGVHGVEEALNAQKPVEKIFISKDRTQPGITDLIKQARKLGIPVQFVPTERLQRYSKTNHQGIVALISPVAYQSLQQVIDFTYQQGSAPLLLLLDGITDVRNFGAIARTAWASGVHALIIAAAEKALINDISIKTSAGALLHIPVCREKSMVNTLMLLKQQGIQVIAAKADGGKMVYDADLKIPTAIVLGSEGFGLSERIEALCDVAIKIPMMQSFNSYNVSVAAGMILYECMRQRLTDHH